MARTYFSQRAGVYYYKSDFPKSLQCYVDDYPTAEFSKTRFDNLFKTYSRWIANHLPEGFALYSKHMGYFEMTFVISGPDDTYFYVHIDDIRYYPNSWWDNILIRSMSHPQDWVGGVNHRTCLFELGFDLRKEYNYVRK